MKLTGLLAICAVSFAGNVWADLTVVQKIEGGGQSGEIVLKIKGDKERIDSPSQPTRIIDGGTGEMISIVPDKKTVVRVSADQMKAAADTISKFDAGAPADAKPKLTPTGKKDIIDGYEANEYVYQTPQFKATFWVAPSYPSAVSILKQMQVPVSRAWKPSNLGMPDYRDFAGVPLKTVISVGTTEVTTTITSIKEGPISDSEFAVPKDYQEVRPPALSPGSASSESKPAPSASPSP